MIAVVLIALAAASVLVAPEYVAIAGLLAVVLGLQQVMHRDPMRQTRRNWRS